MHPLLNIAVRAARAAGDVLVRQFDLRDQLVVESKAANDFVSDADRRAEREIVQHIRKAYPEHAILAEESGADGEDEVTWIIDPLDGTTNFLRGLSHFAVSIAVTVRGELDQGVIYNPLTQDLYCASRGKGVTLNSRRLRVGKRKDFQGALLATGYPYREGQALAPYLELLGEVSPGTAGIRRCGSAALDLAGVASGTYDGFWETHLQPWDIAAGALMIREAGGMVSDFHGGQSWMESGHIVAGSPRVQLRLLEHIQPRANALLARG